MRFAGATLTLAALLAAAPAANADTVADWDDRVTEAGVRAKQAPFVHTRSAAIVHLAMFEAVNAIDGRYHAYRAGAALSAGASREAAAAAAAHAALQRLYPDQVKVFDAALDTALAPIAESAAKSSGLRIGRQAADAILALRAKDGADAPGTWRPQTSPGVYVPTAMPVASHWGRMTPFVLKDAAQFRPPPPIALTSARWAGDYGEVKAKGARTSSARTAEQTDIARVWELTGPPFHSQVVRQLVATRRLDLLDSARLFALHAMAMADSYIAVFDAKYHYNFWRPVTAARNGDIDGNDATERDAGWEPLVPTPMHPEYPCAHCINSGAGAAVLEAFFGDAVPEFGVSNPAVAGVTRRFRRLSALVSESIDARVLGGMHYRFSGEVGAAMGRQIGEYVVRTALQPRGDR